jgi:hypothetical protein
MIRYPTRYIIIASFVVSATCFSSSNPSSTNVPRSNLSTQSNIEVLSQDPKCFIVRDFLSREECEKYIEKADNADPSQMRQSNAPKVSIQVDKLWPLPVLSVVAGVPPVIRLYTTSSTIDLETALMVALPPIAISIGLMFLLVLIVTELFQKLADTSSRTSESLALNTEEDIAFIQTLVDRASMETNHDWRKWEAPVITKYRQGALFAKHNDASPTKGSEWKDLGGQRVVTVITYLNTCKNGGGTKFDELGFTVQPQQGSALIFFPADPITLEADERTIHQSLPAIDDKYIVQLFGRCERVPPPLGIPECYDANQ